MCDKHALNDMMYIKCLKTRIKKIEHYIRILDDVINTDIDSELKSLYKNDRDEYDNELLELKGELAEIEFNQDLLPQNDTNDTNDTNDDLFNTNDNGWHTITTTETTDHPLNTCEHQFVDVFDFKEITTDECHEITKKYILSYCKMCGLTINNPNNHKDTINE